MDLPSPPLRQFVAAWGRPFLRHVHLPLAILQVGRAGEYVPAFLFRICGHLGLP